METTREYALEQLQTSGEAPAARCRAAAHFLALAEAAEPHLTGPEQTVWLDRLEAEHDNLRAALGWSVEADEVETGLRLATALTLFWFVRGHAREGREWFEDAASRGRAHAPLAALRANALSGTGYLASHLGDFAAAFALGEAGLAIARELGDRREIARALHRLAIVAGQRGERDRPAALFEEALAYYRELDDQHGIAHTLANLGQELFIRGELDRAGALLPEAVERMRALGEQRGLAVALGSLGLLTAKQGDLDEAAAMHEEAIAIYRRLGFKRGLAIDLDWLAGVARLRGDLDQARSLQAESLALWRELGDPVDLAVWFGGFAALEARAGRPDEAARYLGVASGLRQAVGHAQPSEEISTDEGTTQAVRDALGERAFVAAWEAGRSLPIGQALAEVAAATASPADPADPTAVTLSPVPSG